MEDPMLIVTRLAYGVPEGRDQLDDYVHEALEAYGLALYAHMRSVKEAVDRFRDASDDPTQYRSDGLASITERLARSLEPFLTLDREFSKYEARSIEKE